MHSDVPTFAAGRSGGIRYFGEVMILKKRSVRLAALFLAAVITATSVSPVTAAVILPVQYQQPFMQSVSSRIGALQIAWTDNVVGQYGLLYKLEILGEYAMYLCYLAEYQDSLGVAGSGELDYYAKDFVDKCVNFDAVYSNDSKKYVKAETGVRSKHMKDAANIKKQAKKMCSKTIPDYLQALLQDVKDGSEGMDGTEMQNSYGVLLSHVYGCIQELRDTEDDVTSFSPFADKRCKKHVDFDSVIKMKDSLAELEKDFAKLVNLGRKVAEVLGQDVIINVDTDKSFPENMANVVESDSGDIIVPEGVKLSLAYLATLAASAVYTPLESYVGDSVFKAALRSLVTDELAVDALIDFYDDTKDYRKPLYKREINVSGNPTGKAELLTVHDFFSDVMEGNTGALVTVQGKLLYDASNNYWVYSDTYKANDMTGTTNASFSDEGYNENVDSVLENAAGFPVVDDGVSPDDSGNSDGSNGSGGSDGPGGSGDSDGPSGSPVDSRTDLESLVQSMPTLSLGNDSWLNSLKESFGVITAHAIAINGTGDTDTGNTDTKPDTVGSDTTIDDSSISVTTVESSKTQTVSGMGTADAIDAAVMADAVITSEDRMSEPVLLYGTKYSRSVDNLTTLIMRNVLIGTVNYDQIAPDSNDYLYMNAYGDIVTDENLVIFPGSVNPLIYGPGQKYNPFSVAFMNYYPMVLQNTGYFQVSSENDIGKYMIFDSDNTLEGVQNAASEITTSIDVKATAPIQLPEFYTDFVFNHVESEKVLSYQRMIFGTSENWAEGLSKMYQYTPLIISNQLNNAGVSVFPYVADEDANPSSDVTTSVIDPYSVASLIAQNMYACFAQSDSGSTENQAKLSDNYLVYYFIISNLNGTTNPAAFASNDAFAYDRYTSDSATRKEQSVLQTSKDLLEKITSVSGVIGIKNSYQSKILGPLFAYMKEYAAFVFIVVLIILMYAFLRVKRDGFQVLVLFSASLLFFYAFIYLLPVYVPMVYNAVINNLAENFTYEMLGVKTEYNDASDNDVNNVDSDGNYVMNTSSLTLYRVATWDQKELYGSSGISEEDVVGGRTYIVNQEAGLFIEGDSLKVNSDILFDTLKIKGAIDESSLQYHLASYKTVSNNVDYYIPYYEIVDSFIGNLNRLSDVYCIPRKTSKYANGKVKDNYLVYSFVNSSPFLTPGHYDLVIPEDHSTWTEEELEYYTKNSAILSDALQNTFGEEDQATDWLGVSGFLYNLSDAHKQTLWANTLKDNGYYNWDWTVNTEKMDKLVTYVNYQAKRFVYSMEGQIGSLSDDVMIKLISLRALVAFTQYGSEIGHWMYPFSLNYEELTIGDILNCIFTDDFKVFVANDMNVCDYMLYNNGMFHLIMFDCVALLLFLVCSAVDILVPAMYLLLCAILIVKLVTGNDLKVPVKGYLKCTFVIMLCSTFVCVGVIAVRKLNGSVIGIYAMLLILLCIVYFLFSIISAVILNVSDFGNTAINARISAKMDSINVGRKELFVHNARVNRDYRREMGRMRSNHGILSRYRRGSSIDSMYSSYSGRLGRHGSYGSYSGHRDYGGYGSSRINYGGSRRYNGRSGYGHSSYGRNGEYDTSRRHNGRF